MAETVVSSTFNIFDLFVRLIPGCVLVGCYYCCFRETIPFMDMDPKLLIVLNVAIAYIVGTLLRAPWRIIKTMLDKFAFGDNPRFIYTQTIDTQNNKCKTFVIKEFATRTMAKKLVDDIIAQSPCLAKCDDMKRSHYAFGHMVNYLEVNGRSSKTDRIGNLADMCSSVIVTLIICAIMLIVSAICCSKCIGMNLGLSWNLTFFSGIITALVFAAGIISSCYLYVHYTQVRFSMTIIQYSILIKKES